MTKTKSIIGFVIAIIGWVLIWSQIPAGLFSKTGAIVITGAVIVYVGNYLWDTTIEKS